MDSLLRSELIERIARAVPDDAIVERMDGLFLTRASAPAERFHGASVPSFCVIAQGRKVVHAGDVAYAYDAQHYLLATLDLPLSGRIVEASAPRPYLAMRLELDAAMVSSVMGDAGLSAPERPGEAKAIVVSWLDAELLEATVRLVRLLESPAEVPVLRPLITREIVFRLLLGEQGSRLRHLPALSGQTHLIAQAMERLRKEYDQPVRIESLARELGMSPSGFHQHFKSITDMSPLQYQKQLRLHEARRLMLAEHMDAATAGFRVGYNDASHFSRDYKKHYGTAPARDIEHLRSHTVDMVVSVN